MTDDTQSRYVDRETIEGRQCDHFAFSQPKIDWDIWIATGEEPLPCRLDIVHKDLQGPPRSQIVFSAIDLGIAADTAEIPVKREIPMTLWKFPIKTIVVIMMVSITALPINEAYAQRSGRGTGRSSVRQSRNRPTHLPAHRAPSHRPPPHRSPSYRPPQHRPPHRPPHPPPYYRARPPRHHGRHYRDYPAWRTYAGVTALIAIGTMLATLPPETQTIVVHEKTYYVHENVYYEKVIHGGKVVYQVVTAP